MITHNHMLLIEDSDGDLIDGHDCCSSWCSHALAEDLGVPHKDAILMGYSGETEFNTICVVCNVVIHGFHGSWENEIKCSDYECEVCTS